MSSPTSKRRRRLTPEARKMEILAAAEALIRQHGSTVRVEDVVKAAGAAKGTFYAYFGTWDDMLETLRDQQVEGVKKRIVAALEQHDDDWMAKILAFSDELVDCIVHFDRMLEAIFSSPFIKTRPLIGDKNPVVWLMAIINDGQKAGAYPQLDAWILADLIYGMIIQTAMAIYGGAKAEKRLSVLHAALERLLAPNQA